MAAEEITCRVGFSLADTHEAMCALIERLQAILLCMEGRGWHIDLGGCREMGPFSASVLLATVLEGRARGQGARVTLPKEPAELAGFCEFSGLNHFLAESGLADCSDPANDTVALRVLRGARFSDPEPIIELIRRSWRVSEEFAEYLRICANEAIRNVADHAESRIGAVLCARVDRNARDVRVAVVDRGLGVVATLAERYPELGDDPEAALRLVISGDMRTWPGHLGHGISNLYSIAVNQCRGSVCLITGHGVAFHERGGRAVVRRMAYEFPGTAVLVSMPIPG